MAGPAAATHTMSRRGLRRARKFHWNWLGVPKEKLRTHQEEKSRQQDCTKQIDMLERVETHSAQARRRVVSEPPREAMCRFVQCDCEDCRNYPRRSRVNERGKTLIHLADPSCCHDGTYSPSILLLHPSNSINVLAQPRLIALRYIINISVVPANCVRHLLVTRVHAASIVTLTP